MALPPEPLDEILPLADACVWGRVSQITFQGQEQPLPPSEDPHVVETPRDLPSQQLELELVEVWFGDVKAGQSLRVHKPAGDYVLREGVEGPYLLQAMENSSATQLKLPSHEIIGRYGPDTYSATALRGAIKVHKGIEIP